MEWRGMDKARVKIIKEHPPFTRLGEVFEVEEVSNTPDRILLVRGVPSGWKANLLVLRDHVVFLQDETEKNG